MKRAGLSARADQHDIPMSAVVRLRQRQAVFGTDNLETGESVRFTRMSADSAGASNSCGKDDVRECKHKRYRLHHAAEKCHNVTIFKKIYGAILLSAL
jgi:hypothetical protein